MKVKELIEKLMMCDQESQVVIKDTWLDFYDIGKVLVDPAGTVLTLGEMLDE